MYQRKHITYKKATTDRRCPVRVWDQRVFEEFTKSLHKKISLKRSCSQEHKTILPVSLTSASSTLHPPLSDLSGIRTES